MGKPGSHRMTFAAICLPELLMLNAAITTIVNAIPIRLAHVLLLVAYISVNAS